MPRGKPKVKTAQIQLRIDPRLKVAAEHAATLDQRNLSNWIEVLIVNRCKELNVTTPTGLPQENHA